MTGPQVTAILMEGLILLGYGVALGRVCACSLRSRLVIRETAPALTSYIGSKIVLVLVHLVLLPMQKLQQKIHSQDNFDCYGHLSLEVNTSG